ncbi:Protein WAX2 [Panicum miliaceum]|uniref:Protein WAX2 n=1 Tax=Panicum miliaceum TaxID=4540 RepID=A0A3L6QSL4_PANMI|nr:Protein WAX2 [Panicum miliaceum]
MNAPTLLTHSPVRWSCRLASAGAVTRHLAPHAHRVDDVSTSPCAWPPAAVATSTRATTAAAATGTRGELGWKDEQRSVGKRSTKGARAMEIRRGMGEPGIGGGVAGIHSPRHGCRCCGRRRRRTGRGGYPEDFRGFCRRQFRTNFSYLYGTLDASTDRLRERALRRRGAGSPSTSSTSRTSPRRGPSSTSCSGSPRSRRRRSPPPSPRRLNTAALAYPLVALTSLLGTFGSEANWVGKLNIETWFVPRFTSSQGFELNRNGELYIIRKPKPADRQRVEGTAWPPLSFPIGSLKAQRPCCLWSSANAIFGYEAYPRITNDACLDWELTPNKM